MELTIYVVTHPNGARQVFLNRADAVPFANPLEGGKPVYPAGLPIDEYVAVPKSKQGVTA